ncbi:MAG: hypothetical protein RI922_865 [Bacteroidota bacterium]
MIKRCLRQNMKLIALISSILLTCACDLYNYDDEAAWSKWANEEAPLSSLEIDFIDSLMNINRPISIRRTFIGRLGEQSMNYELTLHCDSLIVTANNKDSIEKIRFEIVNELYSNVISDSVIYDMNRIYTHLNVYKTDLPNEKESFTLKEYLKDSLEQWNGFKVIKIGKNTYKRVAI